jgi:magnesium chelatase subunit I
LVANATRRALRLGERDAVPRVSDLESLASSTSGKVEVEAFEEGRADSVVDRLVRSAVLTVFRERCAIERLGSLVAEFEAGVVAQVGDGAPSAAYVDLLGQAPSLRAAISPLVTRESPSELASAIEFVLEGLHLSRRLNKDPLGRAGATYRGR